MHYIGYKQLVSVYHSHSIIVLGNSRHEQIKIKNISFRFPMAQFASVCYIASSSRLC